MNYESHHLKKYIEESAVELIRTTGRIIKTNSDVEGRNIGTSKRQNEETTVTINL